MYFLCTNNSDWIFQKYVKIKAMDPEKPAQGSLCLHLHLVSLSQCAGESHAAGLALSESDLF